MNEHDIEKKTDEILMALGKELSKSRKVYAEALLDESMPDPPFVMHEKAKSKSSKKMLKRALILVAVLTLTLGMLVVSVDAVRLKLFEFFMVDKDGYTDLQPSDGKVIENEMPEFYLIYVPEGYALSLKNVEQGMTTIIYKDDNDQYINFEAYTSNDTTASIDNENLQREQIRVNEFEGWHFYNDDFDMVVWQVGDYLLNISSSLGKEETLKIAQNTFIK